LTAKTTRREERIGFFLGSLKHSSEKSKWVRGGVVAVGAVVLLLAGCASPVENSLRLQHEVVRREFYVAEGVTDPALRPAPALMTLDDYLQHAFRNHPGLRAAFERWQAALERIPQARSLDDPEVTFEYFIRQMDTRYQVNVTQSFPAPGMLRLRSAEAGADVLAAMHAFDAARFSLFENVNRAFYEYRYLARATAVTAESHRLLTELEQAADARYRAGASSFADLINIQVEKERSGDRLISLREQRRVQSAGLAALLNLPAEVLLPWPNFEAPGPVWIDEASLAGQLADLNPELKEAGARVEAAAYRREMARRSGWPRFMLGAGWMVMPGKNGDESDVGLMAGVSVPVWRGRYRAERREAGALLQSATYDQADLRNRLRAELSRAVFQFREAERQMALFNDSLLPKAGQALAAAQEAYAEGQADFTVLMDARRTWLEFQLLAERAVADREIALGDIGCCIGAFDLMDLTSGTEGLLYENHEPS